MKWKPIETAPKGGVRVLLFVPDRAECVVVGFWTRDWSSWMAIYTGIHLNATHWMPLPEPPK